MLLSTLSYAEVDIKTLDNFHIDDLSENELTVAKVAEDVEDQTQLGFHMERPHCIPNYPYLMMEVPKGIPKGANVYAKMTVDKNKPSNAKLYLEFVIDSSDGKKVGWFALKKFHLSITLSKVEMSFNRSLA